MIISLGKGEEHEDCIIVILFGMVVVAIYSDEMCIWEMVTKAGISSQGIS